MKRVLVLILMILMMGLWGQAAPRNLDKGLQKKFDEYKRNKKSGSDKVRVIVQSIDDPDEDGLSEELGKHGSKRLLKFETFHGVSAEVPLSELERVSNHPAVLRILEDQEVISHAAADASFNWPQLIASMDPSRVAS